MKKFMLLIVLWCTALWAQDDAVDRQFSQANELYRAEQYQEAITKYEYIAAHFKLHSADLYFNLGNAYYKLNRIAPAVYNYERALLLDPENEDVRTNLGFAHKMMIDEVAEVPPAGFNALLCRATGSISPDGWAWTAVVLSFLCLSLFCGYYFSGQTTAKRVFFIAMLTTAFLVALTIFAAYYESARAARLRPAIVFDSAVSVRAEPKDNSSEAAVIHEGTKVHVLEDLDEWRHVKLPNGNDGWVKSAAIKELKTR